MHSEVIPGWLDQMNKIAQHITSFHLKATDVVPTIADALNILGFRNFATLTVNKLNIVQRSAASFAPPEMFFGRDLHQIIDQAVISSALRSGGAPVFQSCHMNLHTPCEQVYNAQDDQHCFGLFSVFRDQFTHGFVVVFGPDIESLRKEQWRLQAIAQLTVEIAVKLPVKKEDAIELVDQEIAVLAATHQFKTAGEVATLLGISIRRVNMHIARSIEKLSAVNKQHAAQKAKEMGLF